MNQERTSTRNVLILGGRSDMGLAIARRFASDGYSVILAARNADSLETACADIEVRCQSPARAREFDVLATESFESFVDSFDTLPDIVVCVIGLLGDQSVSEQDLSQAALVMQSNYEGPALILSVFADRFAAKGSGAIVGVSSVAGERGRASNYVYGSAKAGFTAFLSGLRARLSASGAHVITVKPGFVRTQMTEGMKLPGPLTAAPEEVADAIASAVAKGKSTIYVRPVWFIVMAIIKMLPEWIFKRMKA